MSQPRKSGQPHRGWKAAARKRHEMSQRDSGYERKDRDCYETPEWVTLALVPHLPARVREIWEPACGSGKIVRALEGAGYKVIGSDLADGCDFLEGGGPLSFDAIIT